MKTQKYRQLVYFLLGFGIFMFTRMSKVVPFIDFAILIAPIFILRFIRTQPTGRGIWLTLLGFLLSMNIALWGLFDFDDQSLMTTFSLIRSSLLAVVWFLPFMIDRLIYPKYQHLGIFSTITFPIITTALFFISSLEGPFDDGGGTTSSFGFGYGSLTFTQVRSLFGVWILVFIHSWLFSIANYCWENQFKWHKINKLVIAYPVALLLIFLFGILKTSSIVDPKSETVKIASVVLLPENRQSVPMARIFDKKATSHFSKTISRIEDRSLRAAENEAKIVSFQEFTMVINKEDENRLKTQFQRIAKQNSIYLSITYAYFAPAEKGENKHLFIDADGEILLDYTKRYLLGFGPFGESGVFKKGAEVIQSVDTPFGRIGISICRDMSFPSFIRQAANDNVDIMLSPSYDWPKSSSAWYISSSIENGFSFVRPTYNGYSYASDFHGNELANMDTDETKNGIMYADVPTKGIKVLYPVIGDLLGWLCLVVFFMLISYIIIGKAKFTSQTKSKPEYAG